MVPFRLERRRVEATNVETSGRGMGTDARRVSSGGRAIRYFRDIHGSESIGYADPVRVHGDDVVVQDRRKKGDTQELQKSEMRNSERLDALLD